MKIAAIFSLVISVPLIFYQLWAFVKPGLRKEEQKAAIRYVPYAFLLFIVGITFGYYVVFPMTLSFTTTITQSMGLQETYGITNYLNFMFNLALPLALLFELPLVVMFLTKIRILNPSRLRKCANSRISRSYSSRLSLRRRTSYRISWSRFHCRCTNSACFCPP